MPPGGVARGALLPAQAFLSLPVLNLRTLYSSFLQCGLATLWRQKMGTLVKESMTHHQSVRVKMTMSDNP
jgi:hypothetical protein